MRGAGCVVPRLIKVQLFDKLVAAALGTFTSELKETRKVLQDGIDTYRAVNGMPLLYSGEPVVIDEPPADPKAPKPIVGSGDFLTLDLLQELAREHAVRWNTLPELETVARERGWVDTDGKLVMLPKVYAGAELGDLTMLAGGQQ